MFSARTHRAFECQGQSELVGPDADCLVDWAHANGVFAHGELLPGSRVACTTNGACVWFVLLHACRFVRMVKVEAAAVDAASAWDSWQQSRGVPRANKRARA
jgi:hypothetical protein